MDGQGLKRASGLSEGMTRAILPSRMERFRAGIHQLHETAQIPRPAHPKIALDRCRIAVAPVAVFVVLRPVFRRLRGNGQRPAHEPHTAEDDALDHASCSLRHGAHPLNDKAGLP